MKKPKTKNLVTVPLSDATFCEVLLCHAMFMADPDIAIDKKCNLIHLKSQHVCNRAKIMDELRPADPLLGTFFSQGHNLSSARI
jgi:hypothetical protein